MKGVRTICVALGIALSGAVALADDTETTIDKVPQSLRAAIDQKVAGGKITEVSTEGEGDKKVFDIEFTRDGKTTEFSIDARGTIKEEAAGGDHNDGGGELAKTPAAVQETAKRILGDHKCDGADKETDGGKLVYEVSYSVNGTDYAVIVAEDGAIVAQEIEVDPSVVPGKVNDALRAARPDAVVKETSIVTENGQLFYEYDVKVGKEMHEVRVGAAGTLISDKAVAPEAPAGGEKADK